MVPARTGKWHPQFARGIDCLSPEGVVVVSQSVSRSAGVARLCEVHTQGVHAPGFFVLNFLCQIGFDHSRLEGVSVSQCSPVGWPFPGVEVPIPGQLWVRARCGRSWSLASS